MYLYVYSIYINKTLSLTASVVGIKFSNITYFLSIIRQLLVFFEYAKCLNIEVSRARPGTNASKIYYNNYSWCSLISKKV
jgi:hypothetical protein